MLSSRLHPAETLVSYEAHLASLAILAFLVLAVAFSAATSAGSTLRVKDFHPSKLLGSLCRIACHDFHRTSLILFGNSVTIHIHQDIHVLDGNVGACIDAAS